MGSECHNRNREAECSNDSVPESGTALLPVAGVCSVEVECLLCFRKI